MITILTMIQDITKIYSLPLSGWAVSKKKTVSLNMNWYRNAHFQVSNKIKIQVSEYLLKYTFQKYTSKIKIDFVLYFKDNRRRDVSNFESIANKFILDALVDRGIILDDDFKHYPEYTVKYGGKADINAITFQITEIGNKLNNIY